MKYGGRKWRRKHILILGKFLCIRGGSSQKSDKAFKWYRKAYDSGNKDAVIQLGYCYSDGIGVEKNSTTAIKYFEEAAFAGDSSAVTSLKLEYGWRVKKLQESAYVGLG